MCLYILHRWHIVLVFWRGALSRVGTRLQRRWICHFTLGGNPSRATIVLYNRQEMVKHIILTHWALWHGQFYCCHRWRVERKLLLMLLWAGRGKDSVILFHISLLYACFSLCVCACVCVCWAFVKVLYIKLLLQKCIFYKLRIITIIQKTNSNNIMIMYSFILLTQNLLLGAHLLLFHSLIWI